MYVPRSVVRDRVFRSREAAKHVRWICGLCLEAVELMDSKPSFFQDFMAFLGHPILELRVIDTANDKVIFQDYNISNPNFFAQSCKEHNGKAQVYFSAQSRDGNGGKYENVPALTWIPIDVDAARPNEKTEPANEEQRQNALRNTAKIIRELGSRNVEPSLWIDTGNGALILTRISSIDTHPHFYKSGDSTQNRLSDMVNWWLQHWVKPLCDDTVEIDSVGDLPRILGVSGTINMKSPRDQPRVRKIIYGDIAKPPQPQPALWQLIEDCWKQREVAVQASAKPKESRSATSMNVLPPYLRDLYEKPDPTADRSLILTKTIIYLANEEGWTKDECVHAMEFFTEKIGRDKWPAAQQFDKLIAEGKIQPRGSVVKLEPRLGKYNFRAKKGLKDTVLVYEGDEPVYPLRIMELNKLAARKALAESLGVDLEEVNKAAAALLADYKPPHKQMGKKETTEKGEKHSIPDEVKAEALRILESQDPIEYISDTVSSIHYGDRGKVQFLWLGTLTPGLGYELFFITVGQSGVGKSDIMYAVLLCVPDEYCIRLKECSEKAVYYAASAGIKLDKAIINFDDVADEEGQVKLLKDLGSSSRHNPRLWTVTKNREFLDIDLPGDWVVYTSAIQTFSKDKQGQFLRRYIVLNPEESTEVNKAVLEKIKEDMRMGRGRRFLPPGFEVAKELTRIIKEEPCTVHIPFDFSFPNYGPLARTDIKQFSALIWAVTKARFKHRLRLGDILLAQPDDFDKALELWKEKQPLKVDVDAVKILNGLGDEEPMEHKESTEGVEKYWTPEPITSTIIAKRLKMAPGTVWEKLDQLYSVGAVDRKAVGGRGNPYAYWKSPSLPRFVEKGKSTPSIDKTTLVESVLDYFKKYGSLYNQEKTEEIMVEYINQIKRYCEDEKTNNKTKPLYSSLDQKNSSTSLFTQNSEDTTLVSLKLRPPAVRLVYTYRRTPPAEKCELCGELATEYVIHPSDGTVLRRCQICFNQIKTMFTQVEFVEE